MGVAVPLGQIHRFASRVAPDGRVIKAKGESLALIGVEVSTLYSPATATEIAEVCHHQAVVILKFSIKSRF
jgi:hypothetical protein